MKKNSKLISKQDLLRYEICSSWWARFISWDWLQNLSASYFIRKVDRKYKRYRESMILSELMLKSKSQSDDT